MSQHTKEIFIQYFDEGMSPASAKNYHELMLENENHGSNIFEVLANAQLNPTDRQIYHLYDQWR